MFTVTVTVIQKDVSCLYPAAVRIYFEYYYKFIQILFTVMFNFERGGQGERKGREQDGCESVKKNVFLIPSVEYLEHVIDASGLHTALSKAPAIDGPPP